MAYYIDEIKKTAVKAEGKAIFGWNHESHMFDMPIADATPKSRMSRCSFFEARRYLFEQDPRECSKLIVALVNKIEQRPEHPDIDTITVNSASDDLKAVEAFKEEVSPEIQALRPAVEEYGMEMSDIGRSLSNCIRLLETEIELARNSVEIARCKDEIEKCEKGQCEECSYAQDCDKKKETGGK